MTSRHRPPVRSLARARAQAQQPELPPAQSADTHRPIWGWLAILTLLLSIALTSVGIGSLFGAAMAGSALGALVLLTGILVGLRVARAAHVAVSMLALGVAVGIWAVYARIHDAGRTNRATVDVIGTLRPSAGWNGRLDVGRSASFTVSGVSGFQAVTVSFFVDDVPPRQSDCFAHTTLDLSGGVADSQQPLGSIGPFDAVDDQTFDVPIPQTGGQLTFTVVLHNTVDAVTCPVELRVDHAVAHH